VNRSQQNALKNYDPTMGQHRMMRNHQWQVWKSAKGVWFQGTYRRSWTKAEFYCICGVRKTFLVDSLGRRVWTKYTYPSDGSYRLADLGLSKEEINDYLWLVFLGREATAAPEREFTEQTNEEKARQANK
jgi:hypothetical protein